LTFTCLRVVPPCGTKAGILTFAIGLLALLYLLIILC